MIHVTSAKRKETKKYLENENTTHTEFQSLCLTAARNNLTYDLDYFCGCLQNDRNARKLDSHAFAPCIEVLTDAEEFEQEFVDRREIRYLNNKCHFDSDTRWFEHDPSDEMRAFEKQVLGVWFEHEPSDEKQVLDAWFE